MSYNPVEGPLNVVREIGRVGVAGKRRRSREHKTSKASKISNYSPFYEMPIKSSKLEVSGI